jgi:hypothetical protein
MVVNLSRINHHKANLGGSFLHNLIFMSVNQQIGFMRADLTGLAYVYAIPSYRGRKPNSLALCSRDWAEALLQLWLRAPRGGG